MIDCLPACANVKKCVLHACMHGAVHISASVSYCMLSMHNIVQILQWFLQRNLSSILSSHVLQCVQISQAHCLQLLVEKVGMVHVHYI